ECINNSSNEVNAAGSLIFVAGLNFTNSTNDFSAAGPSNAAMSNLEDLSHNADDVGAEADINNMESIISVSPILTSRIHKDHPISQIIGDLSLTTQTRSMARGVKDQGYPKETIGYSLYYQPENKVIVARNAKFLENSLIDQEASGSLEDLEIIQEEDTHPSLDTSLNHEEEDLEIDEPQSDIVPIRRSTRTRHAPDRMCLYIDCEEHELGDLGEPANYKAALLDQESEKWLNAMNVEMKSMRDNEVWVLVELPPNGKTVGSKWLFKKMTDINGNVHIYKARLVAKGFTQTQGIDYEETFSPVADIRAIRILITIAAYYDYEIWQMDIKTAILNGYLNEEVYMEQPEGFVNPKYPNREKLKLSKSQSAFTPAEIKHMQNVPYASATGYVFVLNGGAIDWKNAKQSIFATSSAKAEYIATFDASKEAVWVRKFISGLSVVHKIKEPISMYCDNAGAIAIANESGITKGARHFRAKVHYLREVIEFGDIKLEKVHTDDNLA
nr:retrotransposon protein, putative, Ty1-copia subclass [Tanacetum cinerariifolium]